MQNFLLIFFLLKISNFYLKNIKIEGNKRIFSEFIKSSFGVKEGERVDFQRLSEGIKNLYKTGYFDQIEIFATTKDTFIDLIIKVSEAPRLKEIIFKENYRIKTKDLEKEISFLKGEALSKSKIFEWKKKIIDFYKNKGFAGTEVYDSILVIDDEASLIFKIKEGAKAKIKKIEIYGNEHFPDKKIEILLKNREKTWYRKANFKEEYFEEDLLKIEEFYKNKGFLSAKVDSHRINEAGNEFIEIDIYITEGKRFYLGDIIFKGDLIFPEKKLLEKFKIKKGKPLNYKKFEESIIEIQGMYADRGYLLAKVIPLEELNDSIVNFEINIKKGKEVYVRKIDVKGNTRTRDYVILRELDIYPGEKFSREKLIKSQRDLYFLNYFEDIKLSFDILPDSENVDLTFSVKEKPTGTIQAGASYSQLQGVSLFIQLSQPNFLGKGQILSFLVEYGKYRKNFQISFTEPWLFQRPYSFGFDIHDLTSGIPREYDERRQGFSLFFSRPILSSDYYRWRIKYSFERINIFNISKNFRPSPIYDIRKEKWPKFSSRLENSF
ncbi:MAG: outer membrane protein assembly factor BamA, partial [candidate division WOR-3 bacterium]